MDDALVLQSRPGRFSAYPGGGKPSFRLSVLIVALAVGGLGFARWGSWSMLDLAVYRQGAGHLFRGMPIYAHQPGLPFTYPPFAAAVFVPAYLVGAIAAAAMMLTVSLLGYLVLVALTARELGFTQRQLALVVVAGLGFEPVISTLGLGQVNLLLAAMVAFDCLAPNLRWRGVLVGVATGIKLTPAIFVLYFILRRDFRSLGRCVLGFAATIAFSFVVSPSDATTFWTKLFYKPDHVGGVAYVGNQSLFGDLVRLTHREHPSAWIYLGIGVGALVLTVLAARRQLGDGDKLAAVVSIAIGGLLLSPISWTHHWIWLVPVTCILISRRYWISAVAVAGAALLAPMWFTPRSALREFHQAWWQAALCLTYAAAGLWFLFSMLRPSPDRACHVQV